MTKVPPPGATGVGMTARRAVAYVSRPMAPTTAPPTIDLARATPGIRYGESPIHGTGVFAERDFAVDEVIEVCPVLLIPGDQWDHLLETPIAAYVYEWEGDSAFALGYGSLYNHSRSSNARYEMDFDAEEITVYAAKPITAGDEICINYNGEPDDASPVWFEDEDD